MKSESFKKLLLDHMGIEAWYLRPEKMAETKNPERSPELQAPISVKMPSSEPKLSSSAEKTENKKLPSEISEYEPFQFRYVYNDVSVWIFDEGLNTENQKMLEDLMSAFDMLRGSFESKKVIAKEKIGIFQWPLIESSDDPARVLKIFFEKHQSEKKEICVSEKIFKIINPHVGGDLALIVMPDLSELLVSGLSKKAIWETLKSIPT